MTTQIYCSEEGVLALRWKDNKVVMVLSTDTSIEPKETIKDWTKELRPRGKSLLPHVIIQYNGHMGGIDKTYI